MNNWQGLSDRQRESSVSIGRVMPGPGPVKYCQIGWEEGSHGRVASNMGATGVALCKTGDQVIRAGTSRDASMPTMLIT